MCSHTQMCSIITHTWVFSNYVHSDIIVTSPKPTLRFTRHRLCVITYPCTDGPHLGHPTPTHTHTQQGKNHTVSSTGRLEKTQPCILTHLHQLDHVRMVEFLENGDLLVHPLQGAFGLGWTLRIRAGPSRGRSSCTSRNVCLRFEIHTTEVNTHTNIHAYAFTPQSSPSAIWHTLTWETSLPHQTLLGQDLHRLLGHGHGETDKTIRAVHTQQHLIHSGCERKCGVHVSKRWNRQNCCCFFIIINRACSVNNTLWQTAGFLCSWVVRIIY